MKIIVALKLCPSQEGAFGDSQNHWLSFWSKEASFSYQHFCFWFCWWASKKDICRDGEIQKYSLYRHWVYNVCHFLEQCEINKDIRNCNFFIIHKHIQLNNAHFKIYNVIMMYWIPLYSDSKCLKLLVDVFLK